MTFYIDTSFPPFPHRLIAVTFRKIVNIFHLIYLWCSKCTGVLSLNLTLRAEAVVLWSWWAMSADSIAFVLTNYVTLFQDLNLRPNLSREARTLPMCYTAVQPQLVSIYIDRSEYYGHRMSRPIFISLVITYFYKSRSTPEVYTFAIPF